MSIYIPAGSTLDEVTSAKDSGLYLPNEVGVVISGMISAVGVCCPFPNSASSLRWTGFPDPNGSHTLGKVAGSCSLWRVSIGGYARQTWNGAACTGSAGNVSGTAFIELSIAASGSRLLVKTDANETWAFVADAAFSFCDLCDGSIAIAFTNLVTSQCQAVGRAFPTPWYGGAATANG